MEEIKKNNIYLEKDTLKNKGENEENIEDQ
jgi:hypothetical protein